MRISTAVPALAHAEGNSLQFYLQHSVTLILLLLKMGFSLVQNQKVICFKHYTLETAREVSLNWLTLFQNLVDFNIKVNSSSCCFISSLNGYWKESAGRVR